MSIDTHADASRGREAISPWAMPATRWKEVLLRTCLEAGDDNVGLVAAGVSFYGFLALVPLLGAIVLSYGLIAEPATIIRHMQGLTAVMPVDAAKLIGEQLTNVVETSGGEKGLGLMIALGLALFGARNGALKILLLSVGSACGSSGGRAIENSRWNRRSALEGNARP